MNRFVNSTSLLSVLTFFPAALPCAVAAAEPVAVFEAREHLGLDWDRTLVTYSIGTSEADSSAMAPHVPLNGAAMPGALRLIDVDTGDEMPFQLWRVRLSEDGSIAAARISFQAALPAGARYRYEFHAGQPASPQTAVAPPPIVSEEANHLTLDNGITALRLPPVGRHVPKQPLRFGSDPAAGQAQHGETLSPDVAPGPLRGVRLADGQWVGGSCFHASNPDEAPRITSYECRVVEQGPLFVDAEVHYTLDNGGWYAFRVRLAAGDAAARIDEQFDMQRIAPPDWRVAFSLTRPWKDAEGWRPDGVFWRTVLGGVRGRDATLDERLRGAAFPVDDFSGNDFGTRRIEAGEIAETLFDIDPWHPWGRTVHYFGIFDSSKLPDAPRPDGETPSPLVAEFEEDLRREQRQQAAVPFVAVVPLNAGTWRGNTRVDAPLIAHPSGDLALHLPLTAKRNPATIIHTGEFDADLPRTFMRRQWALMTGPMRFHDRLTAFRTIEGFINLDTYKDWVLDWPENQDIVYPRVAFGPEDLTALAAQGDAHPAWKSLQQHLYFGDNPRRVASLFSGLANERSPWNSPLGAVRYGLQHGMYGANWVAHYHWATRAQWWPDVEELLASDALADEQRAQLRAWVAAFCHLLSDPNFNPRGSTVHLGNPNMPVNRFMGLPFVAALIPDHPRADEWLRVATEFVPYKLSRNVAPEGGWSELITYYYASAPLLLNGAWLLDRLGLLDDATRRLAWEHVRFTLQVMTPPDPRFGCRILPGFGHEGLLNSGMHLLSGAAILRESNPELAAVFAWAWEQLGKPEATSFDSGFGTGGLLHADLARGVSPDAVRRELASAWLPGFGAVMRAHVGTPHEIYLGYRQGYMISHSDPNQGDFILYARGAPLVPMSLFAYTRTNSEPGRELDNTFGWHSHPRRGSRGGRMGGWNHTSQVHAHFFDATADYLRGYKRDGDSDWTRQIMLMKADIPGGPDYIMMRDSFTGDQPTWFTLRTGGKADRIQTTETGFVHSSEHGARLEVAFLQPSANPPLESRDMTRTHNLSHASALNWLDAGSPIESQRDPIRITVKDSLTFASAGPIPADQDVVTALFPLGPDELAPRTEVLADGVTRVTSAEGVDYVFLAAAPIRFTNGEVSFEGRAGSVRLRQETVKLVLSEGPGRLSYGPHVLQSGVPAVHRIDHHASREPQRIELPPPAHGIVVAQLGGTAADQVAPGVLRHTLDNGFAYVFNFHDPQNFEDDGVSFTGRLGSMVVDQRNGTVRMTVVDGDAMGYGDLQTWMAGGPYEVVFHSDRITGRTAGQPRFLAVTKPDGLERLAVYAIDGVPYAPGTTGRILTLPILAGERSFEVAPLPQPTVFRAPLQWE